MRPYGETLHGPLVRYVKLRVARASGMPLTFSPPVGGRENVPGLPGTCATRNFTYMARGPLSLKMIRHSSEFFSMKILKKPFPYSTKWAYGEISGTLYMDVQDRIYWLFSSVEPRPESAAILAYVEVNLCICLLKTVLMINPSVVYFICHFRHRCTLSGKTQEHWTRIIFFA